MKNLPHTLKKRTASLLFGMALTGASVMIYAQNVNPQTPVSMITQWDKTFSPSNQVVHRKISFTNRYGIHLVADLYIPKNRGNRKLAAIAVAGPFGAVKEQSSGLYAQTLAERGFVTMAFDPSYTGESGGQPRSMASPDINTEDFSAAIDYLGLLPEVNRDRIGILGVCGWGGMALNNAAMDTRVKAVATSVMYDMSRAMGHGVGMGQDRYSRAERRTVLRYLNEQRWHNAMAGRVTYTNSNIGENNEIVTSDRILPAQLPENPNPILKEFFDYYRLSRGYHERSVNSTGAWSTTMPLSFMNMPLLSYAQEVTIPALIVAGEHAHSRYFSEDAYQSLGSTKKELLIIPNANHVDLYDNQAGKIPFAQFEQFFKAHLK